MAGGDLPPGTVLDDQYEIVSVIGRGGMAVVYQARDLRIDRVVALKMLSRHLRCDEAALKRFQREAVAVATLSHPNIINVFGFGSWNSQPYVVMELLDGITLADLIRGSTNPTLEHKVDEFLQILQALSYAHSKGVIHRDLKPSNVMLVKANSTVKLVDFGIAKILPQSGKQLQTLTQTGELFGTVSYMSPEQCRGEPLDARSDIYSMGCLMYEVLSGHPPFEGSSAYAVMAKHLDLPVTKPPCEDPALAGIVLSTLEKDPERRPQSAEELASALRNPSAWKPLRTAQRPPVRSWFIPLALIFGALIAFVVVRAPVNSPVQTSSSVSKEQEATNDEKALEVMKQANELFDKGSKGERQSYFDGANLLLSNRKEFMRAPNLRRFYFWRLASFCTNTRDSATAEESGKQLLAMMEQEKLARGGQIGYTPEYASALLGLTEIELGRGASHADKSVEYGRQLRQYVETNAPDSRKFDFIECYKRIGTVLAQQGRPEAQEFMEAYKQGRKKYGNAQ
jgi:serine/threonine protein kinase